MKRRELLTQVVVSAVHADRELEAQTETFEKLRDLVINAPTRLDALTQQLVDITARIGPSDRSKSLPRCITNLTRPHWFLLTRT